MWLRLRLKTKECREKEDVCPFSLRIPDPYGASLVAHRLKHLPPMQETLVWSLAWEDPLEKEMATHSSFLPGESHGWRSLVGYSPRGHKESDTTERLYSLTSPSWEPKTQDWKCVSFNPLFPFHSFATPCLWQHALNLWAWVLLCSF